MKKILVFGANSAIAKEYLRASITEDIYFVLVSLNEEKLSSLKSDLEARGAKEVTIFSCDLGNLNEHRRLIELVYAKHDFYDEIMLSYGSLITIDETHTDIDLALSNVNLNYVSYISLLELIRIRSLKFSRGVIVVVTSVAGLRGRQSNYIYGSAKSGLIAYTSGLGQELEKNGIKVIDVRPGFIDTPMTSSFKKGILWSKPESVAKGIIKAIDSGKPVIYTPFFWRFIMLIICSIPEKIFRKLSL